MPRCTLRQLICWRGTCTTLIFLRPPNEPMQTRKKKPNISFKRQLFASRDARGDNRPFFDNHHYQSQTTSYRCDFGALNHDMKSCSSQGMVEMMRAYEHCCDILVDCACSNCFQAKLWNQSNPLLESRIGPNEFGSSLRVKLDSLY